MNEKRNNRRGMSTSVNTVISKCTNADVEAVLNLLETWELPEFKTVFQEQEITLRALKFLTDNEICELIPKLGPRSIFRGLLNEWRAQQSTKAAEPTQVNVQAVQQTNAAEKRRLSAARPTEITPIITVVSGAVKSETSIDLSDESWSVNEVENCTENDDSIQATPHRLLRSETGIQNKGTPATASVSLVETSSKQQFYLNFNVYEILMKNRDGQGALNFYKETGILDMKQRKRVVYVIVRAIVERGIERRLALFASITDQLLKLFPSEKAETYYKPPTEITKQARGALFYKYANYTRRLRKEGLLQYKRGRRSN